ncbi:MAG TPA: catalase family protein [Mycobacteriales bacterium]|nr:catalase family protein [Mycobacteriales bacterium]
MRPPTRRSRRKRSRGLLNPDGFLTYLVVRPFSDLVLWLWRLERRVEFLYRPLFDRWLRPPLFSFAQSVQNARRRNEHLGLAEERLLPDEERYIREIIEELAKFTRENWLPGSAQRFGNTKTFGVLRGELTVLPDLPDHLRHGLFAEPRSYPAYVRFSGPGPYAPPDLEDLGQCSVAIKVMGVPGPKLMDDERLTQDLILVSPASFVTPNIRENATLQRWVRAKASVGYAINPGDSHLLHLFMQLLYSPVHANPLQVQYYSNVPFLLGEGQAVQYSLKPLSRARTRIPAHLSENYLREAMVKTLEDGAWSFDFMVQIQTDPHLMPIEDATVKWPERLSPYIPVARLRLPAQRFDSDAQLAFADVLRYNPWHSLPEHKPLGNSNRARRRMYDELATLRQAMNQVTHVEPTGAEIFDAPPPTVPVRPADDVRAPGTSGAVS